MDLAAYRLSSTWLQNTDMETTRDSQEIQVNCGSQRDINIRGMEFCSSWRMTTWVRYSSCRRPRFAGFPPGRAPAPARRFLVRFKFTTLTQSKYMWCTPWKVWIPSCTHIMDVQEDDFDSRYVPTLRSYGETALNLKCVVFSVLKCFVCLKCFLFRFSMSVNFFCTWWHI